MPLPLTGLIARAGSLVASSKVNFTGALGDFSLEGTAMARKPLMTAKRVEKRTM